MRYCINQSINQSINQIKSNQSNENSNSRQFYVNDGYKSAEAYIAHGGGVGVYTYTNTLESVYDSLNNGFKFIEIDMLETSDGHIVGGHDWKTLKEMANYQKINNRPLSLSKVKRLRIKDDMHIITAEDIRNIMDKNKDFILVTDKIKNYELLLKEIPFPDRMIVEVFSIEDYVRALEFGVKYPAWCIRNIQSYEASRLFGFPIVTVDASVFFENEDAIKKIQELHDNNITVMVFYNEFSKRDQPDWIKKYLGKTVSKIYTDTWSPSNLPQ